MKRNKPIRRVSTKRAKELREYAKLRKQFLIVHPYCEWYIMENNLTEKMGPVYINEARIIVPVPRSIEVHHKNGRYGSRLNDTNDWLAVSREGHNWIHSHPKEARAKGYLI